MYTSFELCIFRLFILEIVATRNYDNVVDINGLVCVCSAGKKLSSYSFRGCIVEFSEHEVHINSKGKKVKLSLYRPGEALVVPGG
jgi:hypothetical protein